jgi:3-oxoacyl-[acyl-carrier protein] reductase
LAKVGSLKGRVALVTGASRGIGHAVARGLAAEDAAVVACARSSPDALAAEIEADGGQVMVRAADVSDERAMASLVADAVSRFGRLDIVVANAGVRSTMPNAELDAAEWRRVLDIDLIGAFNTCRVAIPHLRDGETGTIVVISSIAGQVGGTLVNVAYSAAKAGLISMTKALAKELAPTGITVNCVAPGTIDTPFIGDYDDSKRERLRALIPMGRFGTAEDVAAAVLYLASPGARWVTGATLDVNGGQVMR